MNTQDAIADAVVEAFADEGEHAPQFITKAVLVVEGMTADGSRLLYTWRDTDTTMQWDAIGMLETAITQLRHDSLNDAGDG